MIPIKRITAYPYKSPSDPLVEIHFIRGPARGIARLSAQQMDMFRSQLQANGIYLEYHVFADNRVRICLADEPLQPDWWQL